MSGRAPRVFPIAPMDGLLRAMTVALFFIPAAFLGAALAGRAPFLLGPGGFVVLTYAWIWLRMRPLRFEVTADGIDVVWPLRRERIPQESIVSMRRMDRGELRREAGWGARVGAGGLWGGFGWLCTTRRGIVRLYVSRMDDFVWIETRGRPWLITPADPDRFVAGA